MRVIYKEPGKAAEVKNIDNTLETLQALVDGWIEHLKLDEGLGMIINEEGKLHGMKYNFTLGNGDDIVGPAVFVGESGEDFTDITEADALAVMEFLRWQYAV